MLFVSLVPSRTNLSGLRRFDTCLFSKFTPIHYCDSCLAMNAVARHMLIGFLPRLFLMASLVLAAFAHTPMGAAGNDDAQSSLAYMLPDGSIPVICTYDGEDQGNGFHICEFCLIASGASLGSTDDCGAVTRLADSATSRLIASVALPHGRGLAGPSGAPRAPPAVVG